MEVGLNTCQAGADSSNAAMHCVMIAWYEELEGPLTKSEFYGKNTFVVLLLHYLIYCTHCESVESHDWSQSNRKKHQPTSSCSNVSSMLTTEISLLIFNSDVRISPHIHSREAQHLILAHNDEQKSTEASYWWWPNSKLCQCNPPLVRFKVATLDTEILLGRNGLPKLCKLASHIRGSLPLAAAASQHL